MIRHMASYIAMEPSFVAVVIVVTLKMTSADEDSCEVHPLFNTREQSANFFAKPSWAGEGGILLEEEGVFVRRRHCPVRVRVNEEGNKTPSLSNGSNGKDNNAKKNNSQRKLKGSKRKRKKEKRKRFRKKKKKNS
ncbi:hypothetical protein V1264_001914 [Littorina saxatilis]|uniref:Secreted protein n=3 Tax=Littorina saxatilis TaxID=31220 RepID=A0AAN9C2I2_9CAEN